MASVAALAIWFTVVSREHVPPKLLVTRHRLQEVQRWKATASYKIFIGLSLPQVFFLVTVRHFFTQLWLSIPSTWPYQLSRLSYTTQAKSNFSLGVRTLRHMCALTLHFQLSILASFLTSFHSEREALCQQQMQYLYERCLVYSYPGSYMLKTSISTNNSVT